jgi:prolyl-tRNA editing enzyme YbaK/EbsC (Cys-tRNA(Pro) deacylase)
LIHNNDGPRARGKARQQNPASHVLNVLVLQRGRHNQSLAVVAKDVQHLDRKNLPLAFGRSRISELVVKHFLVLWLLV